MPLQFLVVYVNQPGGIYPYKVKLSNSVTSFSIPEGAKLQRYAKDDDIYEEGYIYDTLTLDEVDDLRGIGKIYFVKSGSFYNRITLGPKKSDVQPNRVTVFERYDVSFRDVHNLPSDNKGAKIKLNHRHNLHPTSYDDGLSLIRYWEGLLVEVPFVDETVEEFYARVEKRNKFPQSPYKLKL